MLRTASTIIVDEIHAMANNKRGSHLALSMARLDALTGGRPQRIGLSATVKPIEEVALFLGPATRIVDVGHRRAMGLTGGIPRGELGPVASTEVGGGIYDPHPGLIPAERTTLGCVDKRGRVGAGAHAV